MSDRLIAAGVPHAIRYPRDVDVKGLRFQELLAEFPDPYHVVIPGAETHLARLRMHGLFLGLEPPEHLVRLLGLCPDSDDSRDELAWIDAASLVRAFRDRWGVTDPRVSLPDIKDDAYIAERQRVQHVVDQVNQLLWTQLEADPPAWVRRNLGAPPNDSFRKIQWRSLVRRLENHREKWTVFDRVKNGKLVEETLGPCHPINPFKLLWGPVYLASQARIARDCAAFRGKAMASHNVQ
jgi:hypothetical protein